MYELVPQSVLAEQVMFWFIHAPLEQIWFVPQVFFNWLAVLFEQYELAVPELLHVYVM